MSFLIKLSLYFIFLYSNLYSNDRIEINFKDLEIQEFVNITAKVLDTKILISDKLIGKVDFISNSPINKNELLKILRYSLKSKGYELKTEETFFEIKKIKPKIEKSHDIKNKDTLKISKIVNLKNDDVEDVITVIKDIISKSFQNKVNFTYSKSLNSIILYGSKKDLLLIENLINDLDEEKSQIFVQAKFIEINNNILNEIGFKYGLFSMKNGNNSLSTFSSSLNGGVNLNSVLNSYIFDIPKLTSGLALGASITFLNNNNALDIVSEPSLLSLNNKESTIYVGETISLKTSSSISDGGVRNENYKREDVGLTLKVKPRVINRSKVILNINAILENVKTVNTKSGNADTTKKEVKTTAILHNGESVILGGLIQSKGELNLSKVPYASDLPLLGNLFKHEVQSNNRKTLVIIVTPYIIPKSKDLTYIREKLSRLKNLEEKYLENSLILLNKKNNLNIEKKEYESNIKHEERVKEILGG